MQLSGYQGVSLNYVLNVGGAMGVFNSSFNWILYGVVNKAFHKAYKRLLHKMFRCGQD